jgi:hypothetical protein
MSAIVNWLRECFPLVRPASRTRHIPPLCHLPIYNLLGSVEKWRSGAFKFQLVPCRNFRFERLH